LAAAFARRSKEELLKRETTVNTGDVAFGDAARRSGAPDGAGQDEPMETSGEPVSAGMIPGGRRRIASATTLRILDARLALSEALCEVIVGDPAAEGRGAAREPIDLSRAMVLVPGGRLASALSRRLLARARAESRPLFAPMIVTPKRFGPNLVEPVRPILGEMAAMFSWREVLDRSVAAGDGFAVRVASLFGVAVEPDAAARMRIARRVHRLSSEVAASMWALDEIASSDAAREVVRARGDLAVRLEVLAEFARRRAALLDECGVADRDESLRDAVHADAGRGNGRASGGVVADGIDRVVVLFADPDPVQRALLRRLRDLGVRVEVCVHRADDVDEDGFPVAARWESRAFPTDRIAHAAIRVADRPNGAAEDVVAAIRALPVGPDGPRRPTSDELFVMAPDDETRRAIERALALAGTPAASGEARPFGATRLGTLLARLGELLGDGSAESLAAFVRHDDVACWLVRSKEISDAADRVSAYRAKTFVGAWRDDPVESVEGGGWRGEAVARDYAAVRGAVFALCSPLSGSKPVSAWARPLREVLRAVVGDDPRGSFAGERVGSVRQLDRALAELAEIPKEFAAPVSCDEAIALLLEQAARQEIRGTVEVDGVTVAGWLDAGMADEPHLVLSGFADGVVPSGGAGDSLFPDELRIVLGMPSSRRHAARDAWILDGILTRTAARASSGRGASVGFIVARQTEEGDPLKPSRFLLRVEEAELAERVTQLCASDAGDDRPSAAADAAAAPIFVKTPPVSGTVIEAVSVTGFKSFIECPYLFQLRHDPRLRLDDLDERAVELDARGFGNLVHAALEHWGREEAAASRPTDDAEAIERSVCAHLDALVAMHFPKSRAPALRIQIELARRRLRRFAEIQAEEAKQGWKVHHAELAFTKDAKPGEIQSPRLPAQDGLFLTGRIDRVDLHLPSGRFRALDYKSSSSADPPLKTHVRGGKRKKSTNAIEWKDLQLPLYRVLLRSMPVPIVVGSADLGYFNLAPSAEKSEIAMLGPGVVTDADLDAAEALAVELVGRIQRGEFEPEKRIPVRDGDAFAPIWGRGQRGLGDAGGGDGPSAGEASEGGGE
jgi:hypothetical protein